MEEQIFSQAVERGLFALLFIWLLLHVMKNNKDRETAYQHTISENQEVIKEQASAFSSLSKDVSDIKQILVRETR